VCTDNRCEQGVNAVIVRNAKRLCTDMQQTSLRCAYSTRTYLRSPRTTNPRSGKVSSVFRGQTSAKSRGENNSELPTRRASAYTSANQRCVTDTLARHTVQTHTDVVSTNAKIAEHDTPWLTSCSRARSNQPLGKMGAPSPHQCPHRENNQDAVLGLELGAC
jgi:hypothetical protein